MGYKEVDKNFIQIKNDKSYIFKSYKELTLEGFPWFAENNNLHRLPDRIIPSQREGLQALAINSTGGAVCFCTNSKSIAIQCTYEQIRYSSGMPLAADAGFDLYREGVFVQNVRPEPGEDTVDLTIETGTDSMCGYMLYLPLYSAVDTLMIGFEEGAEVTEYKRASEDRILFYGSSITNGGCASRPGMAYPAIIGRRLDKHTVNLGFSGNAMGEEVLAAEIGKTKNALIVLEYDYNNSVDGLRDTHENFVKTIRKYDAEVPIVICTRVFYKDTKLEGENEERRNIIYETYENAVNSGDKNVYFLCGQDLIPTENRTDYTSDGTHPNDLGFKEMAERITEFIKSNNCMKNFS